MIRGLYTSCSGMLAMEGYLDVVANNLANANTTGFKRDETIFREFPSMLIARLNDNYIKTPYGDIDLKPFVGKLGTGVTIDEIYTQFLQGNLYETSNKLDFAIEGDGFFVVQNKRGEKLYTRDGSFSLNSKGELVDKNGNLVLDQNDNPIVIEGEDFAVLDDGTIIAGDLTKSTKREIAKIKVVTFPQKRYLQKYGYNYYLTNPNAGAEITPGNYKVYQGFLEGSNVQVVKEMVNLITLNRAYSANEKVIRTEDELTGKAVNNVGTVNA